MNDAIMYNCFIPIAGLICTFGLVYSIFLITAFLFGGPDAAKEMLWWLDDSKDNNRQ